MKSLFFGAVAALAISVASTASPAVLNYDETTDGDLSNSVLLPTVFTLDTAGVNTVRAQTSSYFNTSPFDIDAFQVDLAPGISISGISFDVFGIVTVGLGLTISTSYVATSVPTNDILLQVGYGLGLNPTSGSNIAVGPFTDPVLFRTNSFGIGSDVPLQDGQGAIYTYRWTIRTTGNAVTPVPLPASALFLLVGVSGLGLLCRRRSGQS